MLVESAQEIDDPRVPAQPFDPDDLEGDGEVKDDKKDKYSGEDDEDNVFKDDKVKCGSGYVDEFSAVGGGGIMGHMGAPSEHRKKRK